MRALRKPVALALCALITAVWVIAPIHRAEAAEEILVFAAASLKNALGDVANAWTQKTGNKANVAFASSSRLARQIQHGAPADVFISANVAWMDALQVERLIDASSRRDLLSNRIVLIAHGRDTPRATITGGFDLPRLLHGGKLAMAMVDAVPAGIYGKAALTSLGIWNKVAAHVAQTDNVRTALALVARGEAPYGIVYATDAAASDNVSIVAAFPADSHPPIVYPAAIRTESRKKALSKKFLAFLSSPASRMIFERYGFPVLASPKTN
jgi:molybdate transport system substrate-binding protein